MSDEIIRAIGRLEGKVEAIGKNVDDAMTDLRPRVGKLEKNQARAAGMFAAISAGFGIAASYIVERLKA